MTAVLVAVGLGALKPAQVKEILESRDPLGKHQARVAPAQGLFLKSVLYGDLGHPGKKRWAGKGSLLCTPLIHPPRAGSSLGKGVLSGKRSPPVLADGNPGTQWDGQVVSLE